MKIIPIGPREDTQRMWSAPHIQNALFAAGEEVPRAVFVGALIGGVYSLRTGLVASGGVNSRRVNRLRHQRPPRQNKSVRKAKR